MEEFEDTFKVYDKQSLAVDTARSLARVYQKSSMLESKFNSIDEF